MTECLVIVQTIEIIVKNNNNLSKESNLWFEISDLVYRRVEQKESHLGTCVAFSFLDLPLGWPSMSSVPALRSAAASSHDRDAVPSKNWQS